MTIVPYRPLSPDILARIARLQLERVRERVAAAHGADLAWDPAVEDALVARCLAADIGARAIEGALTREVLPALSDLVLARALDGAAVPPIALTVTREGGFAAAPATGATAGAASPPVAPPPDVA
ncbi:C-terminal, D2-small domain-containing protein, of ClpB protein [Methylobacterium sp. yr596]|jgi:type VI secretion system protein VasG|nr:hypothetical protein [Methylobacterium ajmalii]SFF69555.1 C-terminal, D2-small domain-containing protein, of ClpB protein [Methylobacterium sp. yr596]